MRQCLNTIAFIELRNIKYLQNIHIKIPEISDYHALPWYYNLSAAAVKPLRLIFFYRYFDIVVSMHIF